MFAHFSLFLMFLLCLVYGYSSVFFILDPCLLSFPCFLCFFNTWPMVALLLFSYLTHVYSHFFLFLMFLLYLAYGYFSVFIILDPCLLTFTCFSCFFNAWPMVAHLLLSFLTHVCSLFLVSHVYAILGLWLLLCFCHA